MGGLPTARYQRAQAEADLATVTQTCKCRFLIVVPSVGEPALIADTVVFSGGGDYWTVMTIEKGVYAPEPSPL
jgi:hypothetical protein